MRRPRAPFRGRTFLAAGEAVDEHEIERREAAVTGSTVSDIIFTSGTTGQPKGAMLTHGASVAAYDAWTTVVGLRHGDRYLIVNPFFHTFGLKAGILACLITGATIVPHAVFDVDAVMQRVVDERISMLPGAPTIYQSILDHPRVDEFDMSTLRLAVTGAANVPVELVKRMRAELSFETIVTGYGLTEATGIATMCRHDDDAETIATTSGRAIPDVEVLVVDDEGKEVARGEPGEVVVRGYNIMQGFVDDPEGTAAAIDGDGWLHTGDVGVMDERGYLRITDRLKDMYIVGGFNAYPAEIENMILAHPAVSQVAVIGIPDARMGEVGCAFVMARPGHDDRARRADRVVSREDGQLQGAAPGGSGRRVPVELDRQGREERAASDRPGIGVVGPVHDALVLERLHLTVVVTEPAQDVLGVLADERWRARDPAGCLREVDHRAELPHGADDRVVVLGDETEPFVVGVEQEGLAGVHVARDLVRHAFVVEQA